MDVIEEPKANELVVQDRGEVQAGSYAAANSLEQEHAVATEGIIEETKEEEKAMRDTPVSGSSSTSHRPLTRSQTGTVSKRRKRDDSEDLAATKKRTPPSRKKQKSASAPASGTESASASPEDRSQSPHPPTTREGSLTSVSSGGGGVGSMSATDNGQLKFYHASPTSEDQAQPECRLPRSRASLPTPIPNLTKKSRGRRVPTQASAISADADQKDHRLYVCTVTGCGKCFHRGEHLKRHIRSIHTHEKPFKCTFPLCQKFFNRHDNLLQHLKVHRDVVSTEADRASASVSAAPSASAPSPPPRRSSASPPPVHRRRNRERSYSPADEPETETLITNTNTSSIPRTIYNAFPVSMSSYHLHSHSAPPLHAHLTSHHEQSLYTLPPSMSYASTSDTISRITNMAVSSLRTELPHSPSMPSADMRGGALHTSPY